MVFRHIDGQLYAGDFDCIEMGDWVRVHTIGEVTPDNKPTTVRIHSPIRTYSDSFETQLRAGINNVFDDVQALDGDILVCSEDGEQLVTAICAAVWYLHSDDSFEQSVTKATCGFQKLDNSYKSTVRDICESYKHSHE